MDNLKKIKHLFHIFLVLLCAQTQNVFAQKYYCEMGDYFFQDQMHEPVYGKIKEVFDTITYYEIVDNTLQEIKNKPLRAITAHTTLNSAQYITYQCYKNSMDSILEVSENTYKIGNLPLTQTTTEYLRDTLGKIQSFDKKKNEFFYDENNQLIFENQYEFDKKANQYIWVQKNVFSYTPFHKKAKTMIFYPEDGKEGEPEDCIVYYYNAKKELIRQTEFDDINQKEIRETETYKYDKRKNIIETVFYAPRRSNLDSSIIIKKFDKKNRLIYSSHSNTNKNKTPPKWTLKLNYDKLNFPASIEYVSAKVNFLYQCDSKGNWIERKEFNADGQLREVSKREIIYYE